MCASAILERFSDCIPQTLVMLLSRPPHHHLLLSVVGVSQRCMHLSSSNFLLPEMPIANHTGVRLLARRNPRLLVPRPETRSRSSSSSPRRERRNPRTSALLYPLPGQSLLMPAWCSTYWLLHCFGLSLSSIVVVKMGTLGYAFTHVGSDLGPKMRCFYTCWL